MILFMSICDRAAIFPSFCANKLWQESKSLLMPTLQDCGRKILRLR